MIETRGTVPEITEDKEKMEWLDTIKECINNSESELHPYMKEFGGPLVGFGTNYGGYLFVDFDEDLEKEINDSAIDKFYNIIDTNAKKAGISDIPVVFRLGGKEVQDSRTTQRADMIGGIKIGHFNTSSNTAMKSTLSFAAIDPSSGTTGFVMSGHAAISAGGVGGTIYQPSYASGREVGEVDYLTGHFADAAWVEADNVEPEIYYDDVEDLREVRSYYDPDLGTKVYMSGITTGLTYGRVTEDYEEQTSQTFGTLYRQFRADYDRAPGDSGAPVFKKWGDEVIIVGVHRGTYNGDPAFSPISGVILDLGVEPITN